MTLTAVARHEIDQDSPYQDPDELLRHVRDEIKQEERMAKPLRDSNREPPRLKRRWLYPVAYWLPGKYDAEVDQEQGVAVVRKP